MCRCIDLAVRGRVQELDLCFWHDENSLCACCLLPRKFFESKLRVTVLKLEGCRVMNYKFAGFTVLRILSLAYSHIGDQTLSDMVGACPSLESLILECCWELENVSLISCSLRRLVIRHCTDVKLVYMDLPFLCTFEYDNSKQGRKTDPWELTQITEFRTPKDVELVNVEALYLSFMKMDSTMLKHIFAIFPNLIYLRIKGCFVNYQTQAFPGTLKKLAIVDVHIPELIEGFASSIQVLHCDSTNKCLGFTSYIAAGKVNFICLKSLTIAGFFVLSDEALKRLISNCPQLEILNLLDCFCLRQMKIDSQVLKVLTVKAKPNHLESAEIETPNLVSFEYDGPFIEFSKLNFSPALVGRLSFRSYLRYPGVPQLHLLKDVVEKFKNASTLTLDAQDSELIFQSNSRESPLPCWFKWDHLKIKSKSSYTCQHELVNVLFISGCCTMMSIELSSSSIHFKFADPAGPDTITFNAGEVHDCVRDHLIKASFKNFECNSHELRLVKFLLLKAKKLNTLVLQFKSGVSPDDNSSILDALRPLAEIPTSSRIVIVSD